MKVIDQIIEPALLNEVARAIAWTTLNDKGRIECDWEKDFAESEKANFKSMAGAAIIAYECYKRNNT